MTKLKRTPGTHREIATDLGHALHSFKQHTVSILTVGTSKMQAPRPSHRLQAGARKRSPSTGFIWRPVRRYCREEARRRQAFAAGPSFFTLLVFCLRWLMP
jgi:hypothetical protein